MKIVLTGSGSGGHFYPLIAVAERIHDIAGERKLLEPELFYMGPEPFDRTALLEQNITYKPSAAGKIRREGGFIRNFFDFFRTGAGVIQTTFQLFSLYPDVIFSKGGYAAFPTLFAARLLRIPVIIHESDAVPGRVNLWSSSFAKWIGIAHPDASSAFKKSVHEKIALVGNPMRREIEKPATEGAHQFLKLDPTVPTIYVTGGSLGAQAINNVVLDALPELVQHYNIVHQVGKAHVVEVTGVAKTILHGTRYEDRYRVFGLLNTLAVKMVAGVSSLIVSRAGSNTIFEIAQWGIPSILIPIPEDVSHDQTKNAFSYARSGAATVLKQRNVTPNILIAEIARIMEDDVLQKQMREGATGFAQPGAAEKMARIILDTALEHTK